MILLLFLFLTCASAHTVTISEEGAGLNFWNYKIEFDNTSYLEIVTKFRDEPEDLRWTFGNGVILPEDWKMFSNDGEQEGCILYKTTFLRCFGKRFKEHDVEECQETCKTFGQVIYTLLGIEPCPLTCHEVNWNWSLICDTKHRKHCSFMKKREIMK